MWISSIAFPISGCRKDLKIIKKRTGYPKIRCAPGQVEKIWEVLNSDYNMSINSLKTSLEFRKLSFMTFCRGFKETKGLCAICSSFTCWRSKRWKSAKMKRTIQLLSWCHEPMTISLLWDVFPQAYGPGC